MLKRSDNIAPRLAALLCAGLLLAACNLANQGDTGSPSTRGQFIQFSVGSPENRMHALAWIEDHWQPGFAAMAIEALSFAGDRKSKQAMIELLQRKTGQDFGNDTRAWQHWLWSQGPRPHPRYAEVKAALYAMVDVNYREYFRDSPNADIRLDEVQWVGLRRSDDLSPLVRPEMVEAAQTELADEQLVHGVIVNNQARAYARGIVAQHGVVRDRSGNIHFMLVHDGMTGSAAAYVLDTDKQALAASGFLHRGDLLLYDPATQSLWSSLRGQPVVGPLVAKNIQLQQLPAVTTQWGEWRRRHPNTQVTVDDPADQAYLTGQANYRKFVARDRVVGPQSTSSLRADTPVLGLTRGNRALAIPLSELSPHQVYRTQIDNQNVTILTSARGASRAYLTADVQITAWENADAAVDNHGQTWQIDEDALVNQAGERLTRLPTRQATWAAWQGAYQNTQVAHP